MKSARLFKEEVYIRLVESEPALVYTIRYGGFCIDSGRLPLQCAEAPPDFENESARVVRTRRLFGGRKKAEE